MVPAPERSHVVSPPLSTTAIGFCYTQPRSPLRSEELPRSTGSLWKIARIVPIGPSGTWKSHLLEANAQEAVERGLTVAWFSVEDLGAIVRRHRVDDTVSKTFAALGAVTLTVVTSGCCRCRSHKTPPRASAAWSTPLTSGAHWPCHRTCTQLRLGSTNSWTSPSCRRWSIGSCTTPT